MKIENRTKGAIRFAIAVKEGENVSQKLISLNPGITELSKSDFAEVEKHPMFKDYEQTSQLKKQYSEPAPKKVESDSEEVSEEDQPLDIEEIELEAQSKETLIDLAKALDIDTKGLSKKQLIEAIEIKKAE
jgi:hypothetical protein